LLPGEVRQSFHCLHRSCHFRPPALQRPLSTSAGVIVSGAGAPQGMPLTGIAPWGQRPLGSRLPPPRVRNGRNQVAAQRARACVYLY
jgi:hypothetical protein